MAKYAAGSNRETFNPYAAGAKRYGPSGRSAPNMGPVGNMSGYRQRDQRARRNALLRKLKAQQRGAYASADALRK